MDDPKRAILVWITDEGHKSMLLFTLASLLGLGSVLYFVVSAASSPTRMEFLLLLASMVVVFYMSLRSTTY